MGRPRMKMKYIAVGILVIVGISLADAHGSVVTPPPRNAVDKDLAPWNGTVPCSVNKSCPSVETDTGWCPVPGKDGKASGQNGQACFYFSNGCAVGCDTCDGSSRGPIPRCGYEPSKPCKPQKNATGTGQNKVGPGVACKGPQKSKAVPTICKKEHRTININATCGGEDDWYFYSPWRAPGAAPVFDSCGMAGGHQPPQGGYGGIYVNTTHAKLGDRGTEVLPKAPSHTSWAAGGTYEVSWTIEANHGGGYSYRLAPAAGPLNELSFAKIPLRFVGAQKLRWGGGLAMGGDEIEFNGTYTSTGTVPEGSMWARNPIPRNDMAQTGQGFEPVCVEFGMDASMCSGMEDG